MICSACSGGGIRPPPEHRESALVAGSTAARTAPRVEDEKHDRYDGRSDRRQNEPAGETPASNTASACLLLLISHETTSFRAFAGAGVALFA